MTWGNIRMADQLDLSGREWEQAQAYYEIVSRYGQWNQGPLSDGSHYFEGEENPFIDEGMMCGQLRVLSAKWPLPDCARLYRLRRALQTLDNPR